MNDISGKSAPGQAGKLKNLNDETAKSPQGLLDMWLKYFQNLLNAPPVTSTQNLDIKIRFRYENRRF